MKDSVKANLIIFFIIAIIAFGISNTFANLTIQEDSESYKLIPIENDSFEPNYIDKVPTILPKVEKNYTAEYNNTTEVDDNYTQDIEETTESWNETYTEWSEETNSYVEY